MDELLLILFFLIIFMVLIDVCIIGYLPKLFGIWYSIDGIKGSTIMEDTLFYGIKTNVTGVYTTSINTRYGYNKLIILTEKMLVIKNTRLTYIFGFQTELIKSYFIKDQLIGEEVSLSLKSEHQDMYFKFRTKKSEEWITAFSSLGIPMKGSGEN